MWYFDNLGAYKGAAHGDAGQVRLGHESMDQALVAIQEQATQLRRLGGMEKKGHAHRPDPAELWLSGEYTEFNREQN
jgi:hydroxylamine dehydrogenase